MCVCVLIKIVQCILLHTHIIYIMLTHIHKYPQSNVMYILLYGIEYGCENLFPFLIYLLSMLCLFSSINPVEDICNFRLTDPFCSLVQCSLSFSFTHSSSLSFSTPFEFIVTCTIICVNHISCIRMQCVLESTARLSFEYTRIQYNII